MVFEVESAGTVEEVVPVVLQFSASPCGAAQHHQAVVAQDRRCGIGHVVDVLVGYAQEFAELMCHLFGGSGCGAVEYAYIFHCVVF